MAPVSLLNQLKNLKAERETLQRTLELMPGLTEAVRRINAVNKAIDTVLAALKRKKNDKKSRKRAKQAANALLDLANPTASTTPAPPRKTRREREYQKAKDKEAAALQEVNNHHRLLAVAREILQDFTARGAPTTSLHSAVERVARRQADLEKATTNLSAAQERSKNRAAHLAKADLNPAMSRLSIEEGARVATPPAATTTKSAFPAAGVRNPAANCG